MFDFIYAEESILDHPRTPLPAGPLPPRSASPLRPLRRGLQPHGTELPPAKAPPLHSSSPTRPDGASSPHPTATASAASATYYFSHLLNCPYDCRYCFLQGLYRSAHLVLFVNYEDFQQDIAAHIAEDTTDTPYFFSGYDCDSLALEGITHFTADFLPFFADHPQAYFELRTKSVRIKTLLAIEPLPSCVVAFSMTPPALADQFEVGAPPVALGAWRPLPPCKNAAGPLDCALIHCSTTARTRSATATCSPSCSRKVQPR